MGRIRSRAAAPDDFFLRIPRRWLVVFHVAVFFTFAPVGLLFSSAFEPQRPLLPLVVNLIVSGLIAVSWAATFTVSRWFIVGIVTTNLVMFALFTVLVETPIGMANARPSLESVGTILALVVGYVLFVVFISGQGKTTLRLMTEMSLARNIHETLVPPVRMANDRIETLGYSSPSTEMGGDLVDLIDRGDVTDLFLADVSGHGVRAGVVMGMLKSAIRMGLLRHEALSGFLGDLNDVLDATTSAELYATFAGIRIDRTGRAEYALAGHHPIVHYRASSAELQRLGDPTFPLGLFEGRSYETRTVTLEPGDLLAVYTDGLNETGDESGEHLGHEPIEYTLRRLGSRPLPEIQQALFDLADRHGDQTDDRTLLLVRFTGSLPTRQPVTGQDGLQSAGS